MSESDSNQPGSPLRPIQTGLEAAADIFESVGPEVTILLVEANAAIRAKMNRFFADIGCVVFECETMDQAERILSAHGEVIDHLIYDVVRNEAA